MKKLDENFNKENRHYIKEKEELRSMKYRKAIAISSILIMALFVPQIATADPTNQELYDLLMDLDGKLDNLTAQFNQFNNSTINGMDYLNESIQDINFTGVNNLGTDLEIISHELADIQERLGYPMTEPNATIYDDLTLLLEGLTYESGGSVQWLLKNDTGHPYIQILGENQVTLNENLDNKTKTLQDELQDDIENSKEDILSRINTKTTEVLGSVGTNFWIIIILLIIGIFFLAWKFFLQQRFAVQASGRPMQSFGPDGRPNIDNSGRPSCFGDANKFDPGNDPDCVSCPWLQKCQTAIIRETQMGGGAPMTNLEPRYDYAGNIIAIMDDGQPMKLYGCFGREYDPNNPDCQECVVQQFCAEQKQKNQQIQAPPQPQPMQGRSNMPTGRRGRSPQMQTTSGQQSMDIMNEF